MAFDYITGTRFLVSFEGIDTASTFLYFVVSIYVFMAFSTIFHSINSPDNSPFSHSVRPVLFMSYWSFQLYTSLQKSLSALI